MMLPVAQLWWLRPVMSAARVGEQRAVVWKRLYFRPLAASLSKFGVGIGPPNVLDAPKPTSSVMMSSTFGAPLGAWTSLGKSGVESLTVRPILPWNGGSGIGRTFRRASAAAFLSWARTAGSRPEAASRPGRAPAAITAAAARVVRVRMVSSPQCDGRGGWPGVAPGPRWAASVAARAYCRDLRKNSCTTLDMSKDVPPCTG